MQNPFSKLVRYLHREYPESTDAGKVAARMGAITTAAVVGAAMIAGVIPAATLLAIPAMAAAGFAMGPVLRVIVPRADHEPERPRGGKLRIKDYIVTGEKRAAASIFMTQKLIDRLTAGYRSNPGLPAALSLEILRHVKDVLPGFAQVGVSDFAKENPQSEFSFTRTYIDSDGFEKEQKLATVKLSPAFAASAAKKTGDLPVPRPVVLQAAGYARRA